MPDDHITTLGAAVGTLGDFAERGDQDRVHVGIRNQFSKLKDGTMRGT